MSTYDRAKLEAELVDDEGKRNRMYRCPAGFNTIGIGHNLDANPISDRAVAVIFEDDLAAAEADLTATDPDWREHPDEVQRAMLNLIFNLGAARWLKFVGTRDALRRRDYLAAGKGLRNSKWYGQIQPSRRDRIIAQIEGAATPVA